MRLLLYPDYFSGFHVRETRGPSNTLLAVAYDLKVFFTVVGKPPERVVAADVLGFVTAQRAGASISGLQLVGDGVGVSARTVRRRLSRALARVSHSRACGLDGCPSGQYRSRNSPRAVPSKKAAVSSSRRTGPTVMGGLPSVHARVRAEDQGGMVVEHATVSADQNDVVVSDLAFARRGRSRAFEGSSPVRVRPSRPAPDLTTGNEHSA
jgi:hypothetical protein